MIRQQLYKKKNPPQKYVTAFQIFCNGSHFFFFANMEACQKNNREWNINSIKFKIQHFTLGFMMTGYILPIPMSSLEIIKKYRLFLQYDFFEQ